MNLREAAQQALEALERLHRTGDTQVFDMFDAPVVIPALRTALAEPEQDDTALLRQCLDALVAGDWYIDQLEMIVYSADDTGINGERAKVQTAITALRERLGEKK